jgi:hypothetical protein
MDKYKQAFAFKFLCMTFGIFCTVLLANKSDAAPADIIIKLVWTAEAGVYTSAADLDLYVTEPNGEVASPLNPSTILGGNLSSSDTSPETYVMETGVPGDYTIAVKYPAYDTENPQEALVTILIYGGTVINLGPETLGRTVGPTWHAGKFNFPSGAIVSEGDSGSGCFIATAVYGSPLADEISCLCIFRDRYLATNKPGRLFLRLYYYFSPRIADFICSHRFLKAYVRGILKPLVFFIGLLG